MDPELQAIIQSLLGPQASMGRNLDVPPTYSGQPAAPQQQADPRAALMATLYGPPPEAPADPRWATMGKAGRAGLILSALGDVANVLQRRSAKGARTFRPSNYTGEYLEGQRGRAQERYGQALRADTIRRQEAGYRLGQMDREEAAASRSARETERGGGIAGRQEDDDIRALRHKAAAAGVTGAASMTEAQLLDAIAEKASTPKPAPAQKPKAGGNPEREAERAAAANQRVLDKKMAPTKKLLGKRDAIGADIDATVEQMHQGIEKRTPEAVWNDLRVYMKGEGIPEGSPEWNHLAESYWAGVSDIPRTP